jgi:hypothetical protein
LPLFDSAKQEWTYSNRSDLFCFVCIQRLPILWSSFERNAQSYHGRDRVINTLGPEMFPISILRIVADPFREDPTQSPVSTRRTRTDSDMFSDGFVSTSPSRSTTADASIGGGSSVKVISHAMSPLATLGTSHFSPLVLQAEAGAEVVRVVALLD